MPEIKKLSKHIADLIAAGEVVERPASVVKELAENAFDAGAAAVTIEIRGGGLTYIRVSDDGCGITRGDVPTAFLRHATSKLENARGLEAIETLGFRGEALAAIASVSRIEILTKAEGEDEGTRAVLDGGEIISAEPAARAAGTTITVCDLFYNTPARQKYMKTDRAEASAVTQIVTRLALSRPDISVRYLRDGAEELYTPGDSRLDSCVYLALGREFAAEMIPVSSDSDGVKVSGFVSKAQSARGNRTNQFFFVNGRSIRSKTLQAALEQAYRNRLTSGRFPACVLYLEISASRLDVNVHPAKTEVRFLFEKQMFDSVYYAALSALENAEYPAAAETRAFGESASEGRFPPPSEPVRYSGKTGAAAAGFGGGAVSYERETPTFPKKSDKLVLSDSYTRVYGEDVEYVPLNYETDGYKSGLGERKKPDTNTPDTNTAEKPGDVQPELAGMDKVQNWRVAGEIMNTYIVVESNNSLWLIDKHAAHERLHYDRLHSGEYDPVPQMLITPVVVRFDGEGAVLIEQNAELLDRLGFTAEPFGADSAAIRRIPSAIDIEFAEDALFDIERQLRLGGTGTETLDGIYASIACRAAIKAGKSSGIAELEYIAGCVMRGEVRFCPHGRPVAAEITKNELDKKFKRIL